MFQEGVSELFLHLILVLQCVNHIEKFVSASSKLSCTENTAAKLLCHRHLQNKYESPSVKSISGFF